MPAPAALALAKAPVLGIIASAIELARELLDVLRRESEALAVMRLEAPTGFIEAKNRMVVAYRYKLEELQEAVLGPEAEPELLQLKEINQAVMAAARHNAAALEGAIEGNQRLLDIIVKAMDEQRTPATVGYSRLGNRAAPPKRSPASASVMITRKL